MDGDSGSWAVASCPDPGVGPGRGQVVGMFTARCAGKAFISLLSGCLDSITQTLSNPPQSYDLFLYTPGLICPSGHTTAGSFFRDGTAMTGFLVISSQTTRLDSYAPLTSSELNSYYPFSTFAVGETGAVVMRSFGSSTFMVKIMPYPVNKENGL